MSGTIQCPVCELPLRNSGSKQMKAARKHISECRHAYQVEVQECEIAKARRNWRNKLYEALSQEFTLDQQECIINALQILIDREV